MAINPDDITTARVGQLPPASFSLTDLIPHEVGTVLSQGTIQSFADFLAAYIDTTGAVAFRPVTVLDGQTLPDTTELEWILVGKGTFINVNGGADITTTEELNALMSNGTYWFIGVEIPIEVEGIGYVPESIANKISEITTYSEILYPNEKAVHDLADTKLNITDLPSNLTLYPTTTASAIGGYFKMVTSPDDPDYDATAVDVSTGSITTTAQLISSLVAPAGTIIGQPGIINITTIGNIRRVSGSGTADFYFELYHRNLAGTETFIGVSNPTMPITNSVYGQFSTTAVWNDGTFLDTDTIVIKYYANRIAGGVNPVYEFQFGGLTPVRSIVPVSFNVLAGDYELKENKQNALTADLTNTKYPTVTAVNGGLASKADKQGTILYHSVKWFTPSSSVSNVGATVTSIGTQFTSAMVGAILRINNEDRLIITYTSTTVVVVESAYSTNYSGVLAANWGVYSKGLSILPADNPNYSGGFVFKSFNGTNIIRPNYDRIELALRIADGLNNVAFNPISNNAFQMGGDKMIQWFPTSVNNALNGVSDLGLRRNAAGILEIYDGVTATGLLANRRDLMVRKLFVNKSTDNGIDSLQVDGTISMSPATLSTQGVVKSQLSTQYEVGASSNVLDAWMDNEVIFTASCTITVPATLPTNFNFNWLTLAGVTVTWAITSPHTWLFGTPANATEKLYGRMVKRNSTNSIIML